MGCGASKLSDSPASAQSALITLTPEKWVEQVGLPLDASTATLGWCKELGATTMGDLALVGDLMLTRVASELAEIPQAKLTRALSELAAAIHADEGTWPAWGVEGKVDLEPLPELETTGKEEELLLPPPTSQRLKARRKRKRRTRAPTCSSSCFRTLDYQRAQQLQLPPSCASLPTSCRSLWSSTAVTLRALCWQRCSTARTTTSCRWSARG